MKLRALALLVLAAGVFVAMRSLGGGGWRGYVEATAEAAMVGGLADWFAVTALFRHPLGLPIPHTAIVPRRKAALGTSLGDFVQQNFLDADVVADRVRDAAPAARVGAWLSTPRSADRVAGHAVSAMAVAATTVDDAVVAELLRPVIDGAVRRVDMPRLLARALDAALDGDHHQQALDSVLRGVDRLVVENGELFRRRLGEESPWWVPEFVDDRVFARLTVGLRRFVRDVLDDPDHELRRQLTGRLRALAARLRADPTLAARVEKVRDELLERPELHEWIDRFWSDARSDLLGVADSTESGLRRRVADAVLRGGSRLVEDEDVRQRVDDLLVRLAASVAQAARPEMADLISSTVDRWDADETSRRIELQIGRDLQFIRINGTVVGGLAGLVIHTLAQLW